MAASPEAIAAKLAEIISAKGPSAITDDPYGTYQEILKSKTADRKTAGALLHVLVSSVPELAAKNQDAEELSVAVQNECCLSKAMADRMAEVLSLLYSADNMDGRKEMDGDDLPWFLSEEFGMSWDGFAEWNSGSGTYDCSYSADIELRSTEAVANRLPWMLAEKQVLDADKVLSYFAEDLIDYLDGEFENYCSGDDFSPSAVGDFDCAAYTAKWCRKNGFELVSCEGEGELPDSELRG
ncbi:MAG: hypothetical protein MR757_07145 [Proteobacteria bacterium]|jgi:hypothetical protein|nr:hypothetical protein [Succinivibrionaceae bacterium]MCI6199610.1 hypothetical protein [Pseudomonadota bacterium]MDD6547294.1 hypothetical protein [Pseudomonadota bacterium]